ncbi:MAG: tetratricopeptide repeat protein [Blastocatellia bacterium]
MAKNKLKFQHAKMVSAVAKAKSQKDVGSLLNEASRLLQAGNLNLALNLALEAFALAEKDTQEKTEKLLTEIYFRLAANNVTDFSLRITHLKEAISLSPTETRLQFFLAVTLCQTGNFAEAVLEFDKVATKEPNYSNLGYLHTLAKLACNQKADFSNLNLEEASTLKIVENVIFNKTNNILTDIQPTKYEFWQALAQMQQDITASPVLTFQKSLDKGGYKKNVVGILEYYKGVAAMRQGEKGAAQSAWQKAKSFGFVQDHLNTNLDYLLTEQIVDAAKEEKWQQVITSIGNLPNKLKTLDIVKELTAFAEYYIGHSAASEGNWKRAAEAWRRSNEQDKSCRLSQNLALAEEAIENWENAAEAWREMLKRRSRKKTSDNYLNDSQVAAIWKRAAECYEKEEDTDQALTCLKNALKYAENDIDLRLEIVETLVANDQEKAAQNELNRILAIDPKNVAALESLASLLTISEKTDEAIEIWRKVLALDPDNKSAREFLSLIYADQSENITDKKKKFNFLEKALKDLPNDVRLLLKLAITADILKKGDPLALLKQAYQSAGKDFKMVSLVLHESLHVKGTNKFAEEIMLEIAQQANLSTEFWIAQAKMVVSCELNVSWTRKFFDQAIDQAEKNKKESKAKVLLNVFLTLHSREFEEVKEEVIEKMEQGYIDRIKKECPQSGVLEFVEACKAFHDKDDIKSAKTLVKEARRKAQLANEKDVVEETHEFERFISRPKRRGLFDMDDIPISVIRIMEKYPAGPPRDPRKLSAQDREDIEKLMEFFKESFR